MDKQDYMCPIGRDLLLDPVIAQDGYVYNRVNLATYFGDSVIKKSPVTGVEISTEYSVSKQFKNIILDVIQNSNILDHLIDDLTVEEIINYDLTDVPKFSKSLPTNFDDTFLTAINDRNEKLALTILLKINMLTSTMSRALISACSNASERVTFNNTLDRLSYGNNMPRLVLKLLEHNDINTIDSSTASMALISACSGSAPNIALKLLERHDINCNATDSVGSTALMWACYRGMREVVVKLLEYRDVDYNAVDYNAIDFDGDTALTCACRGGVIEIILKLLEYHDINYNQTNNNGYSALAYARAKGMHRIIGIIIDKN
jgi:hypothetical protein